MELYNDAGVVKTEAAELDGGLGFMEDSCAHLSSLVSVPEVEESSCIETIAFSSFNPVPGYRRYFFQPANHFGFASRSVKHVSDCKYAYNFGQSWLSAIRRLIYFSLVPCLYRLLGDLIYLDVVTAEGNSFCITAHTRGFYVNCSKGNVLEPESAKPAMESTTLVGLLRKLSKKFASGIELLLSKVHYSANFQSSPCLLRRTDCQSV